MLFGYIINNLSQRVKNDNPDPKLSISNVFLSLIRKKEQPGNRPRHGRGVGRSGSGKMVPPGWGGTKDVPPHPGGKKGSATFRSY